MSRKYTKEFKVKICQMVLEDDVKISEIAEKFSINNTMVYRWVEQYQRQGDEAFVGTGHLTPHRGCTEKTSKGKRKTSY